MDRLLSTLAPKRPPWPRKPHYRGGSSSKCFQNPRLSGCRHSVQRSVTELARPACGTQTPDANPPSGETACPGRLQTDDLLLQRFPWELWSLLDDDDNKFDFAVSHTPKILVKPSFQAPVKILAVLGNSDQINAQADLQWLDKLPQAEVTLLKQPKRQIFNEALRDQSWGILFFAGHSSGDAGGQIGLNDTDALSFSELSRGLKQAVQNGLTLAILNSCDGMELAQQLGQAQLPYAVVMRELVPDDVAQLFLGYFLSALGKGEPLPRAMRTAREQLKEGVEHEFPCASWLPVLCQNAAAPELRWPQTQVQAGSVLAPPAPIEAAPALARNNFRLNRISKWITLLLFPLGLVGVWAWGHHLKSSSADVYARFVDVPDVPDGLFRYGGSTTWAPIRKESGGVDHEIQEQLPQFQLQYVHPEGDRTPGSAAGAEMLASGKIDFLQSSRLLKEMGDFANLTTPDPNLKSIPVARSFKVVAVHPSLQLPRDALTLAETEDICTGIITNWKSVGGPDLPIQIFDRATESRTKPSLGDQCRSQNLTIVATPQRAIQALAQTPGGFYVNTAAMLVPQCQIKVLLLATPSGDLDPYQSRSAIDRCPAPRPQVNLATLRSQGYPDPLIDTLYVVVKQDGGPGQRAGEAYAALLKTDEGRSRLEETGFLGID